MKHLFLLVLLLACTMMKEITGQRRSTRGPHICHLRQIDTCFSSITTLKSQGGNIITTENGINKFCSSVSTSLSCLQVYLRRCSTPIQREIFNLFTEQFSLRLNEFCNSTVLKNELLKHSPCIHSNVFTSEEYQSTCVNDLLAAFDNGRNLVTRNFPNADSIVTSLVSSNNKKHTSDSLLDISCCGFNRFTKCFQNRVDQHCGKEALNAIDSFISRTIGIGMDKICPVSLFSPESTTCLNILPIPGTKVNFGDLRESPLVKYLMPHFSFLFNH